MTSTTKQVKSNAPKVDSLPLESPQVAISPEIYYFIAEGVKFHNSKWNAPSMNVTVSQELIRDGKMVDRHAVLSCGSMFDRIESITIHYFNKPESEGGKHSWIKLLRFMSNPSHFVISGGINEESAKIPEGDFKYTSGKRAGEFIMPEAKVDSERFTIAKILPYASTYLASKFSTGGASGDDFESLDEELTKVAVKIDNLLGKIAEMESAGKPFAKFEELASGLLKKQSELQSKIESLRSQASEDELKAKAAAKAKAKADILARLQASKK